MKNRSFGIASILILTALMIVFFIPDSDQPQEIRKFKPIVQIHISIPVPNAEYCFMCSENKKQAKSVMDKVTDIQDRIDTLEFPTVDVVLTSLGNYYITGYTSWELNGSVQTASGVTCHKADSIEDSFYNPTTCAIDPSLHDFGDVFFLESFGYFIAEDTGSAILGKHLDLYYGLTYEDNQEALTITGYYEVFSVEYEYGSVQASKYDISELVWEIQNEY